MSATPCKKPTRASSLPPPPRPQKTAPASTRAQPTLETDDDIFAPLATADPPNPYAQTLQSVPPIADESPSSSYFCANCNATLAVGAVVCTACGYNQKTRQQLSTKVASPIRPMPITPSRDTSHSSGTGTGGGSSGMLNMAIGAGLVIIGIVITVASYNAAHEGGRYYIVYGPIIWGAIQFFKGLGQSLSGD